MSTTETLTAPTRYPPPPALAGSAHIAGRAACDRLVAEAQTDYEGYRARLAREFADDGTVTRTACDEPSKRTCRMANALKAIGVKKGDRVVIDMAMSVEGGVAMQARARPGAVRTAVVGGFSAHSLRDRIADTGAAPALEHPLFLLCTAGSTGKPNGAQHCSGGFMVQAATTVRSLIKAAEGLAAAQPNNDDLTSLRVPGSVGEPINPAAREWYHEPIGGGRCPIVDTSWQTETGGHMITPLPGATTLVPGSCSLPFPGIMATIVDATGGDLPNGEGDLRVITKPWPGMIRTNRGDDERYRSSYFPPELRGCCLAGDGTARDAETGCFTIGGRIDDVLNVSGHRMGTMEIDSALISCTHLVAEAAVVGRPDDTTGESTCAFVVLKAARPTGDEAKTIATGLRNATRHLDAREPGNPRSVVADPLTAFFPAHPNPTTGDSS